MLSSYKPLDSERKLSTYNSTNSIEEYKRGLPPTQNSNQLTYTQNSDSKIRYSLSLDDRTIFYSRYKKAA